MVARDPLRDALARAGIPMGITGGGMMHHQGGLVDIPTRFGDPARTREVAVTDASGAVPTPVKSGFAAVTPALQAVVSRAMQISGVPFGMYPSGGKRTQEEQTALVRAGWSKQSNGLHLTANAIDLIPIINGQAAPNDKEAYAAINAAMMQASKELGVPMTWGGSWKSFPDRPHYQVSPQVAASFKPDPNATFAAPPSLDFGPAEKYELGQAGYPGISAPTESELFSALESKYNLPFGFLTGSYGIESNYGKNPNVSSAGARGPFQFIPSTAKAYGLSNPNSLAASAEATARYAADNAEALRSALGREPSAGELYLAHQQGAQGAIALLSNPDQLASQAVGGYQRIAQNLPSGMRAQAASMTAADFANFWSGQFDQKAAGIGASYGVSGAPPAYAPGGSPPPDSFGIKPIADAGQSALDIGGQPAWITTASDQPAVAAPVDKTIPAGPYGADRVVTALQNGDAKAAQVAFDGMKRSASEALFGGKATVAKLTTDIGNYFKGQVPVIQAAFTKYPTLAKAVPADMRPAVDAARKAAPVVEPDSSPLAYSDWSAPEQSDADIATAQMAGGAPRSIAPVVADTPAVASPPVTLASFQAGPVSGDRSQSGEVPFETGSGSGSLFGASGSPPKQSGISAWGASQPSDITPTAPYPKAAAVDAASEVPASGNDLTSAPSLKAALAFAGGPLGGAPVAAGFGSVAEPDPLAATLVPTKAGHISFTPPTGVKSAAPRAAPKKVYQGGPVAGVPVPRPGVSAFSVVPSFMSAIAAANKAGYQTTPTSMLGQLASQGYKMPNFSSGSGGSTMAYKSGTGGYTDVHGNWQATGTYVDSHGNSHSFDMG